ncbi:hypothetical protein BDB01DRAFT_841038 [Pilobolus umbonatus]|nr:hypothetical protein BDB01DRAFT_841038 [Pilobolus umbonatus]
MNEDTAYLLSFVHRLDLSSYTTRGSRYSEEKAKGIVIADELAGVIGHCRNMKELYVGEEMMHAFVSSSVIHTIFKCQNELSTLDFTGFSDKNHLERISFFMCTAFSEQDFYIPFFYKFTASGNHLTRLDLGYTQISSQLFLHLSPPKKLTHLSLQGCQLLTCCSPLIDYIEECTELVSLNMDCNGIGGSRFCQDCIKRLLMSVSNKRNLVALDVGGLTNLDDTILLELVTENPDCLSGVKYLSLAYCSQISSNVLYTLLLDHMPHLHYLNLSRTSFSNEISQLTSLIARLNRSFGNVKVLEVSPVVPKKYPGEILKWILTNHGRRIYYSQATIDPRFCYSKKIMLVDDCKLSAMNQYWSYSY